MCVMSQVMDQYSPHFPDPATWPHSTPPRVEISPNISISPEDLRTLIDSFHKAVEAARDFDRITGQPHCEDPEKMRLVARVQELELKLQRIQEAAGDD